MISHNAYPHCLSGKTLLWLSLVMTVHLTYLAPSPSHAESVLRVAKDGTAEYASVQAAIDAAPAGATIRVGPGVYEEHLKLRKPVVLEGAGWNQTTIAAPRMNAGAPLERAARDLEQQLRAAATDEERGAIREEFVDQFAPPPLDIRDARGVQVRGLKITTSDAASGEPYLAGSLVVICRATAVMTDCALLGSPRGGIQIAEGSDVEIRRSLIAAAWDTGITIGERGDGARSRVIVADCDVRNCHYAGIRIGGANDATIERCRISGAAWHGIRYDESSPSITGNLIFANARCGIYASGKTAATVKQNVFWKNEMDGMSCWFANRDSITENTFVANQREALAVIDDSQPRVERNIFVGHPKAIVCGRSTDQRATAGTAGQPVLRNNLFWKNEVNLFRASPDAQGPDAGEDVPLDGETASMLLDPGLVGAEAGEFSLADDSPARRAGVGASELLALASPWPPQPEELAIIPDGPSRDSRLWKKPGAKRQPSTPPADSQAADRVGPPPPIVLLYHSDADVRIRTVEALAATRDPVFVDDLIRAHAVEFYTPVHNVYSTALRDMTGQGAPRGPGAWKAWLAREVAVGRLKIDYLPLAIDQLPHDDRAKIQPLATQLGSEHLDRMAKDLTAKDRDAKARWEALRYMVANDYREDVQKFFASDWLGEMLALEDLSPSVINASAYFLHGLADAGPVRERINTQVRQCLDSDNPVVLVNVLHLLAGVEGFSTVLVVPDTARQVHNLLEHSSAPVAAQARRAIERVD